MSSSGDFLNLLCIASFVESSFEGGPLAPASSIAAISSAVSGAAWLLNQNRVRRCDLRRTKVFNSKVLLKPLLAPACPAIMKIER